MSGCTTQPLDAQQFRQSVRSVASPGRRQTWNLLSSLKVPLPGSMLVLGSVRHCTMLLTGVQNNSNRPAANNKASMGHFSGYLEAHVASLRSSLDCCSFCVSCADVLMADFGDALGDEDVWEDDFFDEGALDT